MRKSEEQGRLFWVWLLTLPIIGLHAASWSFGSPWPSPAVLRIGLVVLAFPVVFGVGEPLFREALDAHRNATWTGASVIVLVATAGYVAGILAVFLPIPTLAGGSAILIATFLTARYVRRAR